MAFRILRTIESNLEMDTPGSYTSSVYSESLQLDDLLQKLSEKTWQQQIRTLKALEEENRELDSKLSEVRRRWGYLYQMMQEVNIVAGQLGTIKNEGGRLMERQKAKWIVNCTAF